ncbi:MAG: c-type cytochrome [Gammaproteobacteria bacterium]
MIRPALCLCAALLAACGQESPPAAPAASASTATPADPRLAKLYAQTCKACHSLPGTGAPLAGDRAAWAPRVAQGMPVLIERTIGGYKGMPPLGGCMDCAEKEYEALIRFMAALDAAAP